MIHLKNTEFELRPGSKVVKADTYAAFLKGNEVLELAKKAAIRRHEEAERIYQEEKKRGFEEGLEEGKKQTIQHMIEYVGQAVDSYERFEQRVVQLVMTTVEQLLGAMDDRELIIRIVKKALEPAKNQRRVVIRLSPTQVPIVEEQVQAIQEKFRSIEFVDFIRDERLKHGDCIVETEVGVIDARLDRQLDSIRKSLEKRIQ